MHYRIFEVGFSEDDLTTKIEKIMQDYLSKVSSVEKINDITDEVTKLRRVLAALFDESDTRIPRGFNQKSDDYAPRVQAHNMALMELTRALEDLGYRQ